MTAIKNKLRPIAIIACLFPLLSQAQVKVSLWQQAVKEYRDLRFVPAIKLLNQIIDREQSNTEAKAMLASSYKNIRDYKNALYWYDDICKGSDIKAEWALNYADVLANNQEYENAEQWYRRYVELVSEDKRAKGFADAYANMSVFMRNRKDWQVTFTNINTSASEYSPAFYKDGLVFCSNRKTDGVVKHVFEWDETPYSDLYFIDQVNRIKGLNLSPSERDSLHGTLKSYKINDDDTRPASNDSRTLGQFDLAFLKAKLTSVHSVILPADPLPGKVNSKYHEGPIAVLPDGSILFTRNNYYKGRSGRSSTGINKLKLFTASGTRLGDLQPFPYNSDEFSVGHPAVNRRGTLLIFASDMPGGNGGTDLYYCARSKSSDPWGKPVNMGAVINTSGDELFPTLDQDSTLYFSSTGHPGLGGLDIFEVKISDGRPAGMPLNPGAPINSSVDDFGLIRRPGGKSGYFSSNRAGSDDIYSFTYRPFEIRLEGKVADAATGRPLPYSTVSLDGGLVMTSDSAGRFSSALSRETNYNLIASKSLYSTGKAFVSTRGIEDNSTLHVLLKLKRMPGSPHLFVKENCDSLKRLFSVENIYYDLDKSAIRPDAEHAMAHLADLMKAHSEISVVAASHCDSRASRAYNVRLSLRRSESAKQYLVSKGIASERIKTEYYSEERLVNGCKDNVPCPEADQQLNRRTEFYILYKGVNITREACQ